MISISPKNGLHLPTTLSGIVAGLGWALVQISTAAGCTTALTDYKTWGPAVGMALAGTLIAPKKEAVKP